MTIDCIRLAQYRDEVSDVFLENYTFDKIDFPELKFINYKIIHQIWRLTQDSKIVIQHSFLKENLTVKNFRTLRPPNWLNDEVSSITK